MPAEPHRGATGTPLDPVTDWRAPRPANGSGQRLALAAPWRFNPLPPALSRWFRPRCWLGVSSPPPPLPQHEWSLPFTRAIFNPSRLPLGKVSVGIAVSASLSDLSLPASGSLHPLLHRGGMVCPLSPPLSWSLPPRTSPPSALPNPPLRVTSLRPPPRDWPILNAFPEATNGGALPARTQDGAAGGSGRAAVRRPAGGRRLPPRSAAAPRGRPAGGLARSLAGWPAGPAPPLRHGGRKRSPVLEAERQAAGQVSAGPAGTDCPPPPCGEWALRWRRGPFCPLCWGVAGAVGQGRWLGGLGCPLQWGRQGRGLLSWGLLGRKGLTGAPTLAMRLRSWGTPLQSGGDIKITHPGCGAGVPAYPPAKRGGYQDYPPWLWDGEALWGPWDTLCNRGDARSTPWLWGRGVLLEEPPYIRDKGSARMAPSSLG